jgi:hypothetical protein
MASKTFGGLIVAGALLVAAPAAWALGSDVPHASVNGSGEVHAEAQMPQPPERPHVTIARPEIERPSVDAPSTPDSASMSAEAKATAKRAGTRVIKRTEGCTCSPVTTIAPQPVDPPAEVTPVPAPSDGSTDNGSNGSVSVSADVHAALNH